MWRWVAVLAVVSGCTNEARVVGPAGSGGPAPFVAGIELSSSEELLDHGVNGTTFDFAHLRNLIVRVKLAKMPAMAMAEVTFTAPGGERVYETHVPFSPDPDTNTMTMPGAEHPLTVLTARPVAGGYYLDVTVPVLGTTFTRDMKPGPWRVEATVDNQFYSTEMQVSFTQ
jgi:hypothetical protein